ncbi:NACHT N-terminal Helical domain 1-containing protein [Microbispora bryophytorum]|uniref:NACHT N-terminal Helical domain 1-containing protein n=1 Tax=Microbispora bryophytorum TaxID=1460882 RepID=UPI0033EC1301
MYTFLDLGNDPVTDGVGEIELERVLILTLEGGKVAMSGVELALVGLGTALVKSAAKVWLGDKNIAADITASAIDLLSNRASGILQKRRAERVFAQLADVIALKIQPFIETEFEGLAENEKLAAIDAVRDTFDNASLIDEEIFAHDLNSGYLNAYLRSCAPNMAKKALLSAKATALYDILLRESCEYLIQVKIALPEYNRQALTEILKRESDITKSLQEMLSRLPERREGLGHNDFEVYYRRQVATSLDKMELFGATLTEASRRYPLSVAYLSLDVVVEDATDRRGLLSNGDAEIDIRGLGLRVELALSSSTRLFLRGTAGCGKTTLLRWIAVRSALGDFPDTLASWNNTVPFFVPLRRYVNRDLPTPEQFLESVGRHIADEMPKGWVQEQLRAGRALVLVDGLDELPKAGRAKARSWLQELIAAFPGSRYLVTSRPGAAPPSWLRGDDFSAFELQPMSLPDIKAFVHQWHEALKLQNLDKDEQSRIEDYANRLIAQIMRHRHLKSLAETPLLCALLCALHHDRKSHLPRNRMELYNVALDMLLERRDAERDVASEVIMSRTDKFILLRDIAYWLIRNGWSDAEKNRVVDRIQNKLQYMTNLDMQADDAYRHLLERSGLIREPAADRVDFVHRTFQEYLAALEALSHDDIGLLISNAHLDQWREVVIMAAGHAYAPKREELLRLLIARGDKDTSFQDQLHLLAVACLETSPELSVEIRDEIRGRVAKLLPPSNITIAKSLASAGAFVADLLAEARPKSARTTAATIRAAAQIGTEEGLRIIERYKEDKRQTVQTELLTSWARFDPDEYAVTILRDSPLSKNHIYVNSAELVPSLRHLPEVKSITIDTKGTIDLENLRSLRSLRDLDVWNSSIIDLNPIRELPLEALSLMGCFAETLAPLADLTTLRQLSIRRTKSGELDFNILSRLPQLEHLSLAYTEFSGALSLVNLSKLESLYLRSVPIRELPRLEEATELADIWFSSLGITDLTPISGLKKLRRVHISHVKISSLEPLLEAAQMRALYVTYAEVTDISPVSKFNELTTLALDGNDISDLSPVAGLSELEYLRLDRTQVADLSPLANLPKLRSLDIDNTPVEDLSPLANHPSLTTLRMHNTKVANLAPLATIKNLKNLYVGVPDRELIKQLGDTERFDSLRVWAPKGSKD